MSNPESFIEEVNEELRRDKLYALMRRYGWIAVLAVLLLVGGAAWNEWRKASERAQAEAFGDAVIAALDAPDREARAAALAGLDASGGRAGILQLLIAAEAMTADDRTTALRALQAVADDASLSTGYRQLATLKRVIIGGADLPMDEREAALSGLAQPGFPFRPLALEQIALLRIEAGQTDAALAVLTGLLDEPDVTPGLRRRVTQLIVALGGETDAA